MTKGLYRALGRVLGRTRSTEDAMLLSPVVEKSAVGVKETGVLSTEGKLISKAWEHHQTTA